MKAEWERGRQSRLIDPTAYATRPGRRVEDFEEGEAGY
jgi:hypothetical protein